MTGTDHSALEEGRELALDFDKLRKVAQASTAVLPVAVQDAGSGQVLLIGYASREALDYTLQHRVAAFWSTSRDELWVKGATSGDTLDVVDVRVNCEQNALLYLVRPRTGGVCHTRGTDGNARATCYYRRIDAGKLAFVEENGL